MEVDTDNKLKEISESQQMLLSHNNYLDKPCNIKDELPFGVPSSAQATFLNNQNLHHLDHGHDQFQHDGSSPNPIIGVQTGSTFDSFDAFPYGSSSTNIDFYDYDIKPFGDTNIHHHHLVIEHGQVMYNFQADGRGEGYLSLPMFPQRNHPIDLVGPNHDLMNNHEGDMSLNIQEAKPVNFVVPDELSYVNHNTNKNTKKGITNNNTNSMALHSTKRKSEKNRKRTLVKGQWTSEEDRLLVQLVDQHGIRKWSLIAQMLPGRIGKQCRERWHNHLRPNIKKDTWSEEEDRVLIEAHSEIGNKWAEIAKRLPGRTENSIKNHWNATKRRQYSKRKCRSKYPRGSVLQDYIKSLNLDAPAVPNSTTSKHSAAAAAADKPDTEVFNKNPGTNTKVPSHPCHELEYCINDRLVPTFDFNEVTEFDFDENIFQESCCNIDSFLDEIPCTHVADQKNFCVDAVAPVLMADVEVKKENDLVEMISQDI